MNLFNLVRREHKVDKALEELQTDMADAVEESLHREDEEGKPESEPPVQATAEESAAPTSPAQSATAAPLLSLHAQSRLAALASFDKLYQDTNEHLRTMDERLSEVIASYRLTLKFFNVLHADIHRASDLELRGTHLIAEQRKLLAQLEEASRRQGESDHLLATTKEHENALKQDNETLRAALATARMALVESENNIARKEAELGDLVKTLSARAVEVERRSREVEVLREKQIGLSIDLDKALKREAEARRIVEELSTVHANEAAENSSLLEAFGKSQQEVTRLQKALELAQTRQFEITEQAHIAEDERDAELSRSLSELSGLRSEIQNLRSRLDASTKDLADAADDAAKLKFQLSEVLAERQILNERVARLEKENEADKKSMSAASANISQLSLHSTSEQIKLDTITQQCEDLRFEIATLRTRVRELLRYERLYRFAKSRQRGRDGKGITAAMPQKDAKHLAAGRSVDKRRRRMATEEHSLGVEQDKPALSNADVIAKG